MPGSQNQNPSKKDNPDFRFRIPDFLKIKAIEGQMSQKRLFNESSNTVCLKFINICTLDVFFFMFFGTFQHK